MLLLEMLQSTRLKQGEQTSHACTTTFLSLYSLCVCHVVTFFFFSFLARTDVGTIQKMELRGNQAHTWLCEHYTPRGHSGQQLQVVLYAVVSYAATVSRHSRHCCCYSGRKHAEAHTHTETSFIRTRFQNVESETFFLGTWIKGPKRRQSRLDGVVLFL